MNLFNNLRIGVRLGLAFVSLLVLTVAIVGLAIAAMTELNDHAEQIVEIEYAKVKLETVALDNARGSIARVFQLTKDTDPAGQAKARERLQANMTAFDQALAKLDPLLTLPEGRRLLGQAQASGLAYKAAVAGVTRHLDAGQADAAASLAFGDCYKALHAFAADLRAMLDFNQKVLEAKAAETTGHFISSRRGLLALGLAVLLAGALLAWLVSRSITRPLQLAVDLADSVARGDLSSRIQSDRRDEVGQLLQALTRMNGSLVDIVGQVRHASDSIATGSTQIASGNADLSQRTESQASNLQQTAASMEELTATVRHNAATARQATTLADRAVTVAAQGGQVVEQVVGTMAQISASSRRIGDIIGVVDALAFQTNLLALNAAVEAARAGEQGRGFAVVAGEVRNLAQRSAQAAREIKALIGESVEKVDMGTQLAGNAGQTMREIVGQVERVATLITEISDGGAQQASGIEQIGQAVNQLDQVTQQNAALVEESAAAAESLKQQAARLAQTVATFRLEAA